MKLGQNSKDIVTNLVAFLLVIFQAADTAIKASHGADVQWGQVLFVVALAVTAYLTGKHPDLQGEQLPVTLEQFAEPIKQLPNPVDPPQESGVLDKPIVNVVTPLPQPTPINPIPQNPQLQVGPANLTDDQIKQLAITIGALINPK